MQNTLFQANSSTCKHPNGLPALSTDNTPVCFFNVCQTHRNITTDVCKKKGSQL